MNIRIINLAKKDQVRTVSDKSNRFISGDLGSSIEQRLARNELSIIFLNRKGFSRAVFCRTCGKVNRCPNCSISLAYYQNEKILKCHYCSYSEKYSDTCSCGSERLNFLGIGTERVVSFINTMFPQANIIKFDRDTIKTDSVINTVINNDFDIIVATQMLIPFKETLLSKNKFRKFTLVGMIDIDANLYLPNYRSAEHTFELVYHLCDFLQPRGELLIQTHNINHYFFPAIKKRDWKKFYAKELKYRKELYYPPYSKLVYIVIDSKKQTNVESEINSFQNFLNQLKSDAIILGPIELKRTDLKAKYRQQFLLKMSFEKLQTVTKKLKEYKPGHNTHISYNVDI